MKLRAPRIAVALVLVAAPACVDQLATSRDEQGVIGGTMTPEGEYPGVGALYIAGGMFDGAMCTGTLIAPDVVLTAAHCLDPLILEGNIPGFTLAHDTVSTTPTVVPGTSLTQHPMFSLMTEPTAGAPWYDVGLLFLAQPITDVDPIPLPSPEEAQALVAGLDLSLVGYGRTSNETFDTGVMFDAVAPIVSVFPTELQISSPGQPQNCHGDSGGPALADLGNGLRVVGIVSRSADMTGECLMGGIDTRADAYLQFIADTAPTVCVPPDCVIEPPDEEGGGCCSTSRGAPVGSLVLAVTVLAIVLRRRRGTDF